MVKQTDSEPLLPGLEADEIELARQLLSLRREPGEELKQRIEAIPRRRQPERFVPARLAWAAVLLVVAALFVSPPAQATLSEVKKVIGQVHLVVREAWSEQGVERVVLKGREVSLAQAQALLPFEFKTPAYLPPGLVTTERVAIVDAELSLVEIQWPDGQGGVVQLTARPAARAGALPQTLVGPDSSEAVRVNGQEAVVVRGGWDESKQTWGYQAEITTLIWNIDEVQYRLLAVSRVVSLEQLISMAESVR